MTTVQKNRNRGSDGLPEGKTKTKCAGIQRLSLSAHAETLHTVTTEIDVK